MAHPTEFYTITGTINTSYGPNGDMPIPATTNTPVSGTMSLDLVDKKILTFDLGNYNQEFAGQTLDADGTYGADDGNETYHHSWSITVNEDGGVFGAQQETPGTFTAFTNVSAQIKPAAASTVNVAA